MKNLWAVGLLAAIAVGIGCSPNHKGVKAVVAETPIVVYSDTSVVERILTHSVTILYKSTENKFGLGSGVLYEKNGKCYVMTAAHVVLDEKTHGCGSIIVSFTPSDSDVLTHGWKGKLVASNEELDAAIIELVDGIPSEIHSTSFVSHTPKIGREVYAVGNPLGEVNMVTEGIICHNNRRVPWCKQRHLQTTCIGAPGSSGGGVFTADTGECVGLVVRLSNATGILVVLPAKEIIAWLVAENLSDLAPNSP